jgi:hypothetical protein
MAQSPALAPYCLWGEMGRNTLVTMNQRILGHARNCLQPSGRFGRSELLRRSVTWRSSRRSSASSWSRPHPISTCRLWAPYRSTISIALRYWKRLRNVTTFNCGATVGRQRGEGWDDHERQSTCAMYRSKADPSVRLAIGPGARLQHAAETARTWQPYAIQTAGSYSRLKTSGRLGYARLRLATRRRFELSSSPSARRIFSAS